MMFHGVCGGLGGDAGRGGGGAGGRVRKKRSKNWSDNEDGLLDELVEKYKDDWKLISESIPGRDRKACRYECGMSI